MRSAVRFIRRGQVTSLDEFAPRVTNHGRVIRGAVLHYGRVRRGTGAEEAVRFHPRGSVASDETGRIVFCGDAAALPTPLRNLPHDDYGDSLVLPGFIDAHIHFPQYRMLAAPGRDLLDWLDRFTWREELRYGDPAHAVAAAGKFLERLVQHGTTAALVFSSVHALAADALFAAAEARGMAIVTGKTMMDRNAPAGLLDDPETGVADSEALAARWHLRGRLRYAITVRFAVTSSREQLRLAGELAAARPDLAVQSHLCESRAEIARVRELFPEALDYTDVYDRAGLLGRRTLMAHGVHLTERECRRLHDAGATVVHCPTANSFLGSGVFDRGMVGRLERPVGIAVGSDVGAGTGYSMLHTLAGAYQAALLRGNHLGAHELFHSATRGNAELLGLEEEIGCLAPGSWADIVVLDPTATPTLRDRHALSESLEDTLYALALLGDDRAVRAVYVAGRRALDRGAHSADAPPPEAALNRRPKADLPPAPPTRRPCWPR